MRGSQHPQNRRPALNPPPVCFNCGVTGHFVVACPQQSRETPAGFAAAHASGPLSINLHNQQLGPQEQQLLSHPTQQCNPTIRVFPETAYNLQSPVVISHYSASENQPTSYLSSELNRSPHFSVPSFASQNHSYCSSTNPPQIFVSDYQTSFLTSNSSPQSQWCPANSNHSNIHLNHCAFKPGLKQVYSTVSRYHLQYSDQLTSKSGYPNKDSVLHEKSKYLPVTSLNCSFGNSRNVKFKKKGKNLNSPVYPNLIANKTESSIKTDSHQNSATKNLIHKEKAETKPSCSLDNEISALPLKEAAQEQKDLSEKDYEAEIWDWEYHAIFKDLLRDETVELAQPLATSFKSTPVPLFSAWSPTAPSVSRYARKENIKEFTRSVRSSPQWSYMLEDPAFMDLEFEGSLIPLEKVSALISVRNGAINGFDETDDDNSNNIKCRKRERRDCSDENNEQNDVDNQIRSETGEMAEGPLIKKQKLVLLDEQSEREDEDTSHVRFSNVEMDPPSTIAIEDGDGEISQIEERVFSHHNETKRSSMVCDIPGYKKSTRKMDFSSNSSPNIEKDLLSAVAQEEINLNLSSKNLVVTEPRKNMSRGQSLVQNSANSSPDDSMHVQSPHINYQEDHIKSGPPNPNILDNILSIHTHSQNSSDQNIGLSSSHDMSPIQPQNGLKPTLKERIPNCSLPSSSADSMTSVQCYLPFSFGSSRTILKENLQQNSSFLCSNQHEIISPNSQSPGVTRFTHQNSPENGCPNTKNKFCRSLNNRGIVFEASSSTEPYGPETNQPQGQWTEKSINFQTQVTQKSTHQIARESQLVKHDKKTRLLNIYDHNKLPGVKTDTFKIQDPHQNTDTLNDLEIPLIKTYDSTPQRSESEKIEGFKSYNNCAESFNHKSEYLSQNKCHQQSPNCRIYRSRDIESKEKSKSNDNNDKIVDPAISPKSMKVLDKLKRNEKNDPVFRSREDLSKRTRRPQPKVEAAYSRRW